MKTSNSTFRSLVKKYSCVPGVVNSRYRILRMSSCMHKSSGVFSSNHPLALIIYAGSNAAYKVPIIEQRRGLTRTVKHEDHILAKCLTASQPPHQNNQYSVVFLCLLLMVMGVTSRLCSVPRFCPVVVSCMPTFAVTTRAGY